MSAVTTLCLSKWKESISDAPFCQLTDLNSVTIELQKGTFCLAETRSSFDGVMKNFPEFSRRFSPNAQLIESTS